MIEFGFLAKLAGLWVGKREREQIVCDFAEMGGCDMWTSKAIEVEFTFLAKLAVWFVSPFRRLNCV